MNDITNLGTLTKEIILFKNSTAQNIIEIGKRLIQVKEMLPHGEWGRWLEKEVDFHQNTALKFMRVAHEFSNSTSMLSLGVAKVFALLDLPADQREGFIESHPVDEMTTRELQAAIKAKKDAEYALQAVLKDKKNTEQDLQQALQLQDIALSEARELRAEVAKLQHIPPKVIEKVVEPTGYQELKQKAEDNERLVKHLTEQKELLERKVQLTETENQKFKDLKSQIQTLTQKKQDALDRINVITELSGFAVEIDNLLKGKLAPLNYAKSLQRLDNRIAYENLLSIVNSVEAWLYDFKKRLPTEFVEAVDYETVD